MGFWGNVGARVRGLLQWDKERVALSLAKGGSSSTYPQSGFDLMQAYGYDQISDYLKLEHDLMSKFVDIEEMDDYETTSSALDYYADDACTQDQLNGKVIWADSPDRTVKEVITDLFDKRLRAGEEAWSQSRTLCKYGSDYEEILVTEDGVVGLNHLPPPTMRRIEGRRGELYGFIQDFKGRFGFSPDEFRQLLAQRSSGGQGAQDRMAALEDWEVLHMRLRTKQRRSIYGDSVLSPARWIWKRLMLLEDSSLVYQLQRAPQKYVFTIDVGDMPPREAFAYLNKVRQGYKKTKYYNPTTGKIDLKYNTLSPDEDIFIASRGGVPTSKVDVLNSPMWQSSEIMEYFRLKLFAAIKVPKTYLGFGDAVGKGSLSSEDVRFAKAVLRVQREMRDGYSKIARVHLAALNINPAAVDYDVYMTVPSSVFELAQLEVRNAKADFAGRMSQFVSLHWILNKVFGLSEEEIEYIIKERHEEQLADAEIQAKAMGMQMQVQTDAQMAQAAQQPAGAPPGQPAPAPGPAKQEGLASRTNIAPLSQLWTQRRQLYGYKAITERDLFAGNRDHEKKMEDNFEKMMKQDAAFAAKLDNIKDLVNEIRMTRPSPRSGK